jgi:hypothetical protein
MDVLTDSFVVKMMYFLAHFPSSFSSKNTMFRKLAVLPSSGETTQPDELGLLYKTNLSPRQISIQIVVHYNYIQGGA